MEPLSVARVVATLMISSLCVVSFAQSHPPETQQIPAPAVQTPPPVVVEPQVQTPPPPVVQTPSPVVDTSRQPAETAPLEVPPAPPVVAEPVTPAPPVAAPPVPVAVEVLQAPALIAPAKPAVVTNGTLKIDGTAFMKYRYEAEQNNKGEPKGFNAFELDRGYLNFTFNSWEKAKIVATLEAGDKREVEGTTQTHIDVISKLFYFEATDSLLNGDRLRLGMHGLPSSDLEHSIWGYRFSNQIAPDKWGYLPTADLGVSYASPLPWGLGTWAVMIANGESWKARESGRDKDYHLFFALNPIPGRKDFTVALQGSMGTDDPENKRTRGMTRITQDSRDRIWALVAWKKPKRFTLGASHTIAYQSSTADDQTQPRAYVLSSFVVLNSSLIFSTNKFEFVARYDLNDPNLNGISGNETRFLMTGFSYAWNDRFTTLLAGEGSHYTGAATEAGPYSERRYLVQNKIEF